MLKGTAPISIAINMIVAIILLIIGFVLLKKQPTNKIVSITCLVISGLAFVGAISTGIFSYIVF